MEFVALQSLSLGDVHPEGQQSSPLVQAVLGLWTQLPLLQRSVVQLLLSLHCEGVVHCGAEHTGQVTDDFNRITFPQLDGRYEAISEI